MTGAFAGESNPAFEVATVKPSANETVTRRFLIEGDRFATLNTSLAELIQFAYGLQPHQIANGPKWLGSAKFDVVGTAADGVHPSEQEWMKMMANLLAARFQLRFHREKRDLPVFAIVLDREVPNLKPSSGDANGLASLSFHGRGELSAHNANMADLAWELQSAVLDRPVVDKTGLTSRFDFTLTWMPDEFQNGTLSGGTTGGQELPPNLFTAIRQELGLRLKATKSRADVMMVDHVKLPDPD